MRLPRASDMNLDIDRYVNRFIPPSQLHRLPRLVSRFLGYRDTPINEIGDLIVCGWSFVGAFCGIILVAGVFQASTLIQSHHPPLIIASLVSQYLAAEFWITPPSNISTGGNGDTRLPHNPVTISTTTKLYCRPCDGCNCWRRRDKTFYAQS